MNMVETAKHFYLKLRHPLKYVAVELTNDCNFTCSYCHRTMRTIGYMSRDLFITIMNQLPPSCDTLSLSFGGESALHPQLHDFATLAKTKVTNLIVYSNGTYQYPPTVQVRSPRKPPPLLFSANQTFLTQHTLKAHFTFCRSLFNYMAILWNGDITLCCHDVAGTRIIAALSNHTIHEIWASLTYEHLRAVGHCSHCQIYPYIK